MKKTVRLTYEKVRLDEGRDVHLVVSLEAPSMDWQARRPPVCVIPVIDVSGSMQGQKLHFAKQSVMKLVDHLAPGDHCGVVAFDDEVVTVAPPLEMTQVRKDALKATVGQLGPGGSTNFAGGLLAGLEHAGAAALPAGLAKRVIMFTDGRANVGVATTGTDLLRLLRANLGQATVSAFGYGEDADQELLRDLANEGKGNYAYVKDPEDAVTAFARELGGLLSTYARDVELVVRPAAGARVTDVVSDVDSTPDGAAVCIRIPDVLSEELRHLVLGVHVDAAAQAGAAPVVLLEGRYKVLDTSGASREERFELPVEVQRVPAGEEQRQPTREVDEVVAMAQVVRAQIEAEQQARQGAFGAAQQVLYSLLQSLNVRHHAAAAAACGRVLATFADAASYDHSAAFRTSFRSGVTRGARGTLDRDAVLVLEQAGLRLSTGAQDEMVKSFAKSDANGHVKRAGAPKKKAGTGEERKCVTRRRSKRWV